MAENGAHAGERAVDRRRAPRVPLVGVLVTVVSSDGSEVLCASDALDISTEGLALVLPEETNGSMNPGEGVLVSFRLDDGTSFARMPCRVVRKEVGVGAVDFTPWNRPERHRLAAWLEGTAVTYHN